ncbi:hypothetical protein ACFL60_08625 [Candidatus Omnitrophota bacterium]
MPFIKNMTVRKKQGLMFLVVAILGAIGGIIHGIFFDLDFSQIKRLSLLGVVFTTFIMFPAMLFFEWIFDWDNNEEIDSIKERLKRLEQEKQEPVLKDINGEN